MKLTLLITTFLIISFSASSQINCGTPSPATYQKYENTSSKQQSFDDQYCINVYFHIVRKTNGTGGFSSSNINNIVQNLNNSFNKHGVFINNLGTDSSIKNDNYYDIDGENYTYNQLISMQDRSDAIDIYLVNSLKYEDNDSIKTAAGISPSTPSKAVIIDNFYALKTTAIHEIGHALNLLHTHEKEEFDPTPIDNSNCDSTGDLICDTPPDPKLSLTTVDPSCNYTEVDGYNPPVHNYMSYSRKSCRDEFTPGQVDRMKAALANSSILQPVISSSCAIPEITGPDLVCNSNSTFTLQNAPNNVIWNTGSNLTIISQTDSSITVQASNSFVRGESFVEINGGAARKDLYVGKPYANLPQAPTLCTNSFSEPYTLPASEGATSYRLKSNSPYLQINGQSEVTFTNAPTSLIYFSSNSPGTYLVELFTSNGCAGESRGAMYVTSETCGLGGPGGFFIYPNPASSEVTIEANTEKSNTTQETQSLVFAKSTHLAKLFDFSGAFVKDIQLDPYGTTKLDVSNLKEGMYFLKIQVRDEEETYKIIVRH